MKSLAILAMLIVANDDLQIQRELVTFTGLLVVVGFLQFFALVGQVVIYFRQAKIMTRQANSERAWLTAKVEDFDEPPRNSRIIWIEIPITNHGRTPARVAKVVVTPKLIPF